MIESMTGYGGGRARIAGNTVVVSLHSVNNRSFKLNIRMHEFFIRGQQELEELIKGKISRGTIYCHVELDGPMTSARKLDEKTLLHYCRKLQTLAGKAGLPDDIRIEQVAALPGVIREEERWTGELRGLLLQAATKSLNALVASRRKEGSKIEAELRKLLGKIVSLHKKVAAGSKRFLIEHRKKLTGRIKELMGDSRAKIMPDDIAREVAILAERSDIAEELQRLGMQAGQMAKTLSSRKPAGRKLEFIAQEMLREANTMSAKSVSSKLVVPLLELKENIDRVREQAQNVQ
jgi:uncharacterized protein (TIGR00255 family)